MARKKTRGDAEGGGAETIPVQILPNSVFICHEAGLVSIGTVVDVDTLQSETEIWVAWDCRYLVLPERWSVREVVNAQVLFRTRGIQEGGYAGNDAGTLGGELIITEMKKSALEANIVISEEGTPTPVIVEERGGRTIAIFQPGTRMNLARFFSFPDWFAALHGA